MARAYRWGYNYGVGGYHAEHQGIGGSYVDGLSLTHGARGSRQHIWTFASGLYAGGGSSDSPRHFQCPCDNGNIFLPPPFVGNYYFCKSAARAGNWRGIKFYPNASLWGSQVCEEGGSCCLLNNPPWFTKNLTTPTTDEIELRICLTERSSASDVALELLELSFSEHL